ncbi:RBP protein [Beauveria bassiana ARSEF 2860]|uniref:RBP protein n=1 Tax=Beauveria bassiana (strain ARSEF 2860) TaxID=655819 RepID=J4KNI3_BEAB2|nr:RBP protein [Beauveria bassiana ARSEF 2860]EJP65754.1 RBP protein [Beauveria bassiana ARSEF 2860]
MDFTNVPRHHLSMDEPLLVSEIVTANNGGKAYHWALTDTERAHIANLLNVDATELAVKGTIMNRERSTCNGCGKQSGLDDLVHNALHAGIHSAPFMANVLANGPKGPEEIPPHELTCSRCATKHEGSFGYGRVHWKTF